MNQSILLKILTPSATKSCSEWGPEYCVCSGVHSLLKRAALFQVKNKRKAWPKRWLFGTKSSLERLWSVYVTDVDSFTHRDSSPRGFFFFLKVEPFYDFISCLLLYSVVFPFMFFAEHSWGVELFTRGHGCQVAHCVNRKIKISEEMALPALTLPPPQLYLSSCPPSDFSPSDPHLLLRSKRKQTSIPRTHCRPQSGKRIYI